MAKKNKNESAPKVEKMTNDVDRQAERKKRRSSRRSKQQDKQAMLGGDMSFAASEAYKLLRTNLMFSFSGQEQCSVIGVTSAFRGEGKSVTAVNLAYTLAQTLKRVLLIEGDMRLPTMAARLSLNAEPGLSNLLAGMNNVKESIQSIEVTIEEDSKTTLDIMVSGSNPPNPSELLGSERMDDLLSGLRERYDYIILDLPPVTVVTDPIVACKLIDGMIVVVRNNHVARGALDETIRQLKLVDARILGFVYNGANESGGGYYKSRRYYSRYYKKGYYSSYEKHD